MLLQYIRFTLELCADPFVLLAAGLAGLLIRTHPVRVVFLLAFAVCYTIILRDAFTYERSISMYVLVLCRFFGSLAAAYLLYGARRLVEKKQNG